MNKCLIALALLTSSSLAGAATVELPFTGTFGGDAYGAYSPGDTVTALFTYDDEDFLDDSGAEDGPMGFTFGNSFSFTTLGTTYELPVAFGFYDPASGTVLFSGGRSYPLLTIEFSGLRTNLTRPPSVADLLNIRGSFSFDTIDFDPETDDVSFSGGTGSLTIDGSTVGAVPEPASWAMMILGMGMLGGAARYRRRKTNVAFG